MPTKNQLKEIIVENKDIILRQIPPVTARHILSFPISLKKVFILYGIRRSGKTCVLYDLFRKNPDRTLYIDFEDDRLDGLKVQDLELLKDAFFELNPNLLGKECFFLLDEIQNIPHWEKFARRLAERSNIKVIVTGSSSKIMPSDIHTALRGRSWGVELLPFSFTEYLEIKGFKNLKTGSILADLRIQISSQMTQFLKWGGFPEVVLLESNNEKTKVLKEYLGALFFKDLVEHYKITNIPLLDALMDTLFSSEAQKVSLTSFYNKNKDLFPFSKDLLFEYYKYFQQSLLIYETKLFSPSSYKRLRNPPAIYLADMGLARKIASTDYGRILENAVFLELRRRGYDLSYYAEKRECDFIIKNSQGNMACLQVTHEMKEENRTREMEGLIEALKFLKTDKGFIVTADDEEEAISVQGVEIQIMPFWKWALNSASLYKDDV